jgi:hypothetical protein
MLHLTEMKMQILPFFRKISIAGLICFLAGNLYGQAPDPKTIEVTSPNKNEFRDAMRPVPKDAVFRMKGYYLWDPSVIKVDDTYHLFTSRWPEAWGAEGWKRSQVIRATSKNLFGPYTFAGVVLDASTHPWASGGIHNPKITKVGNKFLIYHIGVPQYSTGFAYADKIEGPWTPVKKPVIRTNNPALLIREDGSAYAVGKFKPKPVKDGDVDDYMDAYEAPSVDGPYKRVGDSLSRLPYNFELEDPTIWWANKQYNIVCLDWEAKATGIFKAFTYYTSRDGINYRLYSKTPVWHRNEPVPMQDGSILEVTRLERPQVYLNKKGKVQALLAGAQPKEGGPWFIIIRPVDKFVPKNKN